MNILEKIVSNKRKELEERKKNFPERQMMDGMESFDKKYSLKHSLVSDIKTGIIAEFKRKSPSRGLINPSADPVSIAPEYEKAGVSGLSVLTDTRFFGGHSDDLKAVRSVTRLPILRKDFIIEPYQIIESKFIGADAVLIIASILKKSEVEDLCDQAERFGLEVLFEIHNEEDLEKMPEGVSMIGINNRDLTNFRTDIDRSVKMIDRLPADALKIAESGITSSDDIRRLGNAGFDGFLIGTLFMQESDPGQKCREFSKNIMR